MSLKKTFEPEIHTKLLAKIEILETAEHPDTWPPEHWPEDLRQLLIEFADVITDEMKPCHRIKAPPLSIQLKEDVKPLFAKKSKPVPLHWRAKVEEEKQKLLREGVIRPVTGSPRWISPAKWVEKPGSHRNRFRLVVDLCRLNEATDSECSIFPTAKDVWQKIKPTSKFFMKFDAHSGYHQVEIEESCKPFFCFSLDDQIYRYEKAPMGYKNSGHHFVREVSRIFNDLPVQIEVDDFLLDCASPEETVTETRRILERARERGLLFSRRKVAYGEQVDFAGLQVSREGCKPTVARTDTIKAFPRPTNLTELRSCLGLVNLCRNYMPDLSHYGEKMRKLLKKNVPFEWTTDMEADFEGIKSIMCGPLGLHPFIQGWSTELYIDFSKMGLGFVLTQTNPKNKLDKRIIWMDSTSITEAQSNYPAIYGENMALSWGVTSCDYYLRGCDQFKVNTDHQALQGIYNTKEIDSMSEEVEALVSTTMRYNFKVVYVPGKCNEVADFLSRHPRWSSLD